MEVGFLHVPRSILAVALVLLVFAAQGCGEQRDLGLSAPPPVQLDPVVCARFASPNGSSDGVGTRSRPYASVQILLDSLRPGETGCLEAGTYREDVNVMRGGAAGRPVTLASVPGARARLLGVLWIARGADYVTIRGIDLNGASRPGTPSPQVNAAYTTFYDVDVTNDHTGICFILGGSAATYGVASHTTIAHSRIHDCGILPPGHFDHGVYVAHARDATIVDNAIYDNADWGVHLYPDAQRTTVMFNVLDGNGDGVMLAGTDDLASSDNRIAHNVVSNTRDGSESGEPSNNYGFLITSFWGDRVGVDNLVASNCFWQGASGDVNTAAGGFFVADNVIADPGFVAREAKNFRLRDDSPCAGDGPRSSP
jgi:parallel beta helix pectate lyase-like protein